MRLSDYKALSFDTYGTLIDWETGIVEALASMTAQAKSKPGRDAVLELFACLESKQQAATPTMIYSDLLTAVFRTMAARLGVNADEDEALRFGNSVGEWPAFEDSAAALGYLKQHFRLFTLTNCDQKSYEGSNHKLGRPFDAIYTAEEIGTYKPNVNNFRYLMDRLDSDFSIAPQEVLHVAQSLFHDHVPANHVGLATAWIDRRHDQSGYGATMPPAKDVRGIYRFTSMAELARAHQQELSSD